MARPTTDDIAVRPGAPSPRAEEDADTTDLRIERIDDAAADSEPVLLDDEEADRFLDRWSEVQSRFVDDPQGAVRDGDSLVAELMQVLASRFAEHKTGLEEQWQRGAEPETEDLRRALQSYRSFFQRLLTT